jgi:hypothetical protein
MSQPKIEGAVAIGSSAASGHILDKSEMFMEASCLNREHVFFVAWRVANVGGNETFMQFIIAHRHKIHNRWLRVGIPSHDTNPLASSEPARTAEGDGRGKKKMNLRVAAVSDLPNLASTGKGRWFAHDTNYGLTTIFAVSGEKFEILNWRCLSNKVRTFFEENPAV